MRAIVRDPDIRSGCWRLSGTRITVADVRRWHAAGWSLDTINDADHLPWLQLTQEELDACLAWQYPALGAAEMLLSDGIEFRCACGEWRDTGWIDNADTVTSRCEACGRSWDVTVTIQATPDAGAGEGRE